MYLEEVHYDKNKKKRRKWQNPSTSHIIDMNPIFMQSINSICQIQTYKLSAFAVLLPVFFLRILPDLDTLLTALFSPWIWLRQAFLYVPANRHEYLWHVCVLLCAALDESHSVLVRQLFAFLVTHLTLAFMHVALVSHDQFACFLWLGLVQLFHPVLKTLECLPIVDRIHKDNPRSSFVISFSHCLESLLSRRVPNLHLDLDIINVDGFYFEIHTDGCDVSHFVFFICVTQKNVGLAHCWVPNDDDLDEVIVFLLLAAFVHAELGFLNFRILYLFFLFLIFIWSAKS